MSENKRLGYLLKQAQQALRAQMDKALSKYNTTLPQYAALSALEINAGISNADLARACFVTPQTMIRIIQNLEEEGLIKKTEHPSHGRVIILELTRKGHDLLKKCHSVADDSHHLMTKGISSKEQSLLENLLGRICQNLE